jgi:hypothetical protein
VQHPASVVVMSGIALDGLIVAAAGLAGGLYNWFAARNSAAQPNHPVSALAAHLLSGVIATATVPLLLDILGNNKIRPTFGSIDFSNINYVSGLAVLVGFCALAGRYSDGFLSGLSSRVLRDVQQEVRAVRVEAEQTSVLTTVLSSKQVENDDQEDRKLSQRDPTCNGKWRFFTQIRRRLEKRFGNITGACFISARISVPPIICALDPDCQGDTVVTN